MGTSDHQKTQADHVISVMGGERAVMKLLGQKHPTTIRGWLDRGFIPPNRHQELLDVAGENDLPLTKDDFVAHLEEKAAAE